MKTTSTVLLFLLGSLCCMAVEPARQKVKVGDKIYPVYECYKEVRPESVVMPTFSDFVLTHGQGGDIRVGAVVDENGKVTGTFVTKSTADRARQHAVRMAVAKWRFPKIKDGEKAISCVIFVTLTVETTSSSR